MNQIWKRKQNNNKQKTGLFAFENAYCNKQTNKKKATWHQL